VTRAFELRCVTLTLAFLRSFLTPSPELCFTVMFNSQSSHLPANSIQTSLYKTVDNRTEAYRM